MFGTYQHSNIRIEMAASADAIGRSLTEQKQLEKWLQPQQLKFAISGANASLSADGAEKRLLLGQTFESKLGFVKVTHKVEKLSAHGVRFLLSESIDGFHEWQWGDGWVQSRLEGISLLPLNLGQTLSLTRLKNYLQ